MAIVLLLGRCSRSDPAYIPQASREFPSKRKLWNTDPMIMTADGGRVVSIDQS